MTKHSSMYQKYNQNLQGTPDAYSDEDTEAGEIDENANPDRPERAYRKVDYKELYSSCQNLVLKVEAIIKDDKGNVVVRKPINKFSELFEEALNYKESVARSLITKVQSMESKNKDNEF